MPIRRCSWQEVLIKEPVCHLSHLRREIMLAVWMLHHQLAFAVIELVHPPRGRGHCVDRVVFEIRIVEGCR